jgi:nucleoredoxin
MNSPICLSIALSLVLPLSAAFEKWTNKDGKTAELELMEVTGEGDRKSGTFKMRNGRQVVIKMEDLSEEDSKRLDAWVPAPAPEPENTSVFDDVLDGNLVILDGKKLKKHTLETKPAKYYVFYYTASWCPPCQAFTPSLVDFYNKQKKGNDDFEFVLITSDRDGDAMEGYAKDKKMPWPQLKHSKADTFKSKFKHGVTGIPSVIVCDLEGRVITANGRDLSALKEILK